MSLTLDTTFITGTCRAAGKGGTNCLADEDDEWALAVSVAILAEGREYSGYEREGMGSC